LASTQFAKAGQAHHDADDGRRSYWQQLALSYHALGSPLKPPREVAALIETAVARFAGQHQKARLNALLLGVTPSIAEIAWPESVVLTAADYSLDMVQGVWPGNLPRSRHAVCANWRSLPLRRHFCDVVVGDGSMNCVRFPDEFRDLTNNLYSVLNEQGLALLRFYVKPIPCEGPEDLFAEAARGAIPDFHEFKFRLLMAMQESTQAGVAVDAVYKLWTKHNQDNPGLCERAGWNRRDTETMNLYQGSNTVHTFPALAEIQRALADRFELLEISYPSYPLSERCPILVLKRRNS
jgi:hypothetical protein